jgi:hypothetical protein
MIKGTSTLMKTLNSSKMPQKKVFLIGFWPDYDVQFLDIGQLGSIAINVINLKESRYHGNILARWFKRARHYQLKKLILKLIEKNPGSSFFFQGKVNLTRILNEIPVDFQAAIICRNIVARNENLRNSIAGLKEKGIEIWSFDEADCKTYALKQYSQFVRKFPLNAIPNPAIDLLFVGRNKGRKAMVDKLGVSLSAAGFRVYTRITGSDGIKLISYQEYLALVANSKCLLDVTQDGQNGLSLRPIEAALYGKKIITTNAAVRKTALYNANNVLVLTDATTTDEIAKFLKTAPEPIAAETLYQFSPQHFLTRLLDDVVARGVEEK